MSHISITFAGHSATFIQMGTTKIAVDPWLQGNPLCPEALHNPRDLDLIVLSHGHSDHAGDIVRVASLNSAKIAATYELAVILTQEGIAQDRLIFMNKGGAVTVGTVTVRLTHAQHSSSYDSPSRGTLYAGEAAGVLLSDRTGCVYHAGDTELFTDMKLLGELYKPSIALLPIGDRFTMGQKEAAIAASWLGVSHAIPMHYKTFELLDQSADQFCEECRERRVNPVVLEAGETFEVPL